MYPVGKPKKLPEKEYEPIICVVWKKEVAEQRTKKPRKINAKVFFFNIFIILFFLVSKLIVLTAHKAT